MLIGLLKKVTAFTMLGVALTLAAPTPAKAIIVTYDTTGAFDGLPIYPGASPVALTVGTTTVTFTGFADTVDTDGTGSNDKFGTFSVSGGTNVDQSLAGHTFTLYITQLAPPAVNHGTFTSTLTGTIRILNSKAYVEFNTTTATINGLAGIGGTATYKILNADEVLGGVPKPGSVSLPTPGGNSTINGFITAAVPEPSTMASAAIGLVVLAGAARFRRRKAA